MKINQILEELDLKIQGKLKFISVSYGNKRSILNHLNDDAVAYWKEKFTAVIVIRNGNNLLIAYSITNNKPFNHYEHIRLDELEVKHALNFIKNHQGYCPDMLFNEEATMLGEYLGDIKIYQSYDSKNDIDMINPNNVYNFYFKNGRVSVYRRDYWQRHFKRTILAGIELSRSGEGKTKYGAYYKTITTLSDEWFNKILSLQTALKL